MIIYLANKSEWHLLSNVFTEEHVGRYLLFSSKEVSAYIFVASYTLSGSCKLPDSWSVKDIRTDLLKFMWMHTLLIFLVFLLMLCHFKPFFIIFYATRQNRRRISHAIISHGFLQSPMGLSICIILVPNNISFFLL
jgi:hypothetical protein